MLDPGIGFGKSREQNYEALRAIAGAAGARLSAAHRRLAQIDVQGPAATGVLEGRLVGTLAANLLAARDGAQVFRVHDAAEHRAAFEVLATLAARRGKG